MTRNFLSGAICVGYLIAAMQRVNFSVVARTGGGRTSRLQMRKPIYTASKQTKKTRNHVENRKEHPSHPYKVQISLNQDSVRKVQLLLASVN
jgi:hypothetical protein